MRHQLYRRLVGDPDALIVGARREPDLRWLSLVATVADEERDERGRLVHRHQRLAIGRGGSWRIEHPGYLYAFANDAWDSYGANAGSVRLQVTRTA